MEVGPKADDCQGGEGDITEAEPVGERAGLRAAGVSVLAPRCHQCLSALL